MAKNFQSCHIWMEADFGAQIGIRQVHCMNFWVKKRYPMDELNHKLINWPWVWLLIWLICGIRNQICILLQILVTMQKKWSDWAGIMNLFFTDLVIFRLENQTVMWMKSSDFRKKCICHNAMNFIGTPACQ